MDEWRGVPASGSEIACDAMGSACPWRVADGVDATDWNISAAAAALMVRGLYLKY